MKKIAIASIVALSVSSALMAGVNAGSCFACHGKNFEKHAMGKSKVVSDMTHAEIATSLIGYKNGTYGGPMKGIMKGQVGRYSDADLEAFSKTVGK